ncbi:MAG: antitoxin [Candidatus Hydrogenedentes bacterium]|nr:antitoxin [Candidatus Hydrogenedentota bacterium]
MRTTLTIDDDLYAAARSLARAKSEPLGRVLSDLARRGLNATPRVGKRSQSGFPVFRVPPNAAPITLEDVRKLDDEP